MLNFQVLITHILFQESWQQRICVHPYALFTTQRNARIGNQHSLLTQLGDILCGLISGRIFLSSNLVFDIIYPTIERIKDFVMINRPATV